MPEYAGVKDSGGWNTDSLWTRLGRLFYESGCDQAEEEEGDQGVEGHDNREARIEIVPVPELHVGDYDDDKA